MEPWKALGMSWICTIPAASQERRMFQTGLEGRVERLETALLAWQVGEAKACVGVTP